MTSSMPESITSGMPSGIVGGMSEKVRENRLRRALARQGYGLTKSRRRDPRAYDFGAFWVVDPDTNSVVAGDEKVGMTLDEIEAWANRRTGS